MSLIHRILRPERARTLRAGALGVTLRASVPVLAVVAAGATTACHHGAKPSNVAAGKEYSAGNAEYDAFFGKLYELQLALGQAPDRERAVRDRLSSATGSAPGSGTEQVAMAFQQKSSELAKAGIDLKVTTLGVEKGASPSATLVASGGKPNAKDGATVSAIGLSVKEAGSLLATVREAKPEIEKLKERATELEPGIDKAFEGRSKRADVRQNLKDARQLLPLMTARADEVDRQVTELLVKLEKAAARTSVAAAPSTPSGEPVPKKAKGQKRERPIPASEPAPRPHREPKPAAVSPAASPASAEKPAPVAEKPKSAPAEDFEP